MAKENGFLPINKKEMRERGWKQADFVYVCGDAYVDHPSFGAAIITRLLEDAGYKVAFIAQPDWNDENSIAVCGEPKLAFIVSAGNMDSMVNHYTSFKKRRHQDAYTPGGGFSGRPNRPTIVYSNLIRKTYKKTPILLGGIEASLRRMAHYDYWSDKVKRSVLLDSGADLLMYGMGEHSILEIAEALDSGIDVHDITYVRGTVFKCKDLEELSCEYELLPSYEEITESKETFARSYYQQYINTDAITAKTLVEPYKKKEYLVQNPPSLPLTVEEMDHVYELPYMRKWHPSYDKLGGVPALKEIKFSLTSNRGCFGGCSFCALTFHQGRIIQTRSKESLIAEAKTFPEDPEFKGYIHDVGGPTANFRAPACKKQLKYGACTNKQCLFPKPCKNLIADHKEYLSILRDLRKIPGVKKVFIRSGIRFDYLLADPDDTFFKELCQYHVSGQLKVAPEHVADPVLQMMGKPENAVYERFTHKYEEINKRLGLKQYLVPYLMSSHPGSTMKEAVKLAEYLRDLGYMPEQVQDFYPTPSTISTCMYYTGVDPRTMKPVYVPKNPHEKAMQRALIQYRNPKNYDLVMEALRIADRMDLVGFDEKCLIRPRKLHSEKMQEKNGYSGRNHGGTHGGTDRKSKNPNGNNKNPGKTNGNYKNSNAGHKNTKPASTGNGRGESSSRPQKKKSIRNVHKRK